MKRYLISTVVVLAVLAVALVAFGQGAEEWRQRMAQFRQAQVKAIEVMEQQVAKLKTGMEQPAGFDPSRFQEMSEEEQAKFREERMKRREERQQALGVIEKQITRLKGPRQLRTEHEESIAELQAIHALAVKENAKETAKRLEDIIAKRNKAFEDTMQKLGFDQFGRRP